MIAPMRMSTASQWPASIAVTTGLMPSKAWLVATVVSTKPSQTKNALMMPPLIVTSREMAHQPGEHTGHDQTGDAGDDQRSDRHGLVAVLFLLAEASHPHLAEDCVPAPAEQKARERGHHDGEIVD